MFKVESYISPYLLGYIDKYVKLKQEDFQLSLWGGDAVLSKLDLRLDVLEEAMSLPISFQSGHIHELRLHVPWTKLGSEPVVITINTIECVLRLRDATCPTDGSVKSGSSHAAPVKAKAQTDEEELPPGYLQSILNRILHNVNIIVNNLILKFVEDDIVLSVNVKSAECYSVDGNWARAFIELALPQPTLRRIINIHDLTICLDKRDASGKIEVYQDPVLYRCSVMCRLHMLYDSLHSKLPSATKLNVLFERLDLSLTDTQVPMFCRLVELCIAIYYGTLDPPGTGDQGSVDSNGEPDAVLVTEYGPIGEASGDTEGWASWAWSYVPQILPSGEYEEQEEDGTKKRVQLPVLAIGLYINETAVSFKLSEYLRESPFYGSQKVHLRPCMSWESESIALEVLMKGVGFFNVQLGMAGTRVIGQGEAMCGIRDLEHTSRDPCFLAGGTMLDSGVARHAYHLSQSLFDPGGAENLGVKPQLEFDPESHVKVYSEQYALDKFGVFWMDYLYTGPDSETIDQKDGSASSVSEHDEEKSVVENSGLRFLVGPTLVNISSSMTQRVEKFIHCMGDHEYEPYAKPRTEVFEEAPPPTAEDVAQLDKATPQRTYELTILDPTINIIAADLPRCDVSHKTFVSVKHGKKGSKSRSTDSSPVVQLCPLPLVVLQADRFHFHLTSAMYPRQLVKVVSKLPAPSDDLLYHCHTHTHIKLFGFQAALSAVQPGKCALPRQPILQLGTVAYYKTCLLQQKYWINPLQPRLEQTLDLPSATLSITKPQMLMLVHIWLSWINSKPDASQLMGLSLFDDTFKAVLDGTYPTLELGLSNLEVKRCDTQAVTAMSATLTSVQALLLHSVGRDCSVTPILSSTDDTSLARDHVIFSQSGREQQRTATTNKDLLTLTLQYPNNPNVPQAPAAVLLDVGGVSVCIDPVLWHWLDYQPKVVVRQKDPKPSTDCDPASVIGSVLHVTSPLKHSTQESPSGSTVTNLTDSQTRTHTSHPVLSPRHQGQDTGQEDSSHIEWPKLFAHIFPVIKIMVIQAEIKHWCLFAPSKHVVLREPSGEIVGSLRAAYQRGELPDTLVLCCPTVRVTCSNQRPVTVDQDIPIKAMEQSVAGEKLPWTVALEGYTMYTIHSSKCSLALLKPVSLSMTIAVTTKYDGPLSDNILALGLCLHCHLQAITCKCSKLQLPLIYTLIMDGVESLGRLTNSVDTLWLLHQRVAATAPGDKSPPSASAVTPGHYTARKLTSATSGDQPDLGLATISETSDMMSVDADSLVTSESGPKLSLWLQCTLLKLTVNMYAQHNSTDILMATELEDITSSIDIQDVFSKVKCKVGSFAVRHYTKRDMAWQPGAYKGVIITSADQVLPTIPVATNKPALSRPVHERLGAHEPNATTSRAPDFLSMTLTRALKPNSRKEPWTKLETIDASTVSISQKSMQNPLYLNEICLTVQPLDVLANCPLLSSIINIANFERPPRIKHLIPNKTSLTSKILDLSINPSLTSSNLPLVYINMGHMRLMIPNCSCSAKEDPAGSMDQSEGFWSAESSTAVLLPQIAETDLLVLQVAAVVVKPHADNPLSRNVIDQDLYQKAVHSGTLCQPGSTIENRQYQMDIDGLSLSSGSWAEILSANRTKLGSSKKETVQNPALEWNTLAHKTHNEVEAVYFTPIATSFDMRVVAAPAIVYTPSTDSQAQPTLVCGYSLEVNATSDMNYSLSFHQIQLLYHIYSKNIWPLMEVVSGVSGRELSKNAVHSGVNSDAATGPDPVHPDPVHPGHSTKLTHCKPVQPDGDSLGDPDRGKAVQDQSTQPQPTCTDPVQSKLKQPKPLTQSLMLGPNWTPYDILLTAGQVSCMIYTVSPSPQPVQTVQVNTGLEEMQSLSVPLLIPVDPGLHGDKLVSKVIKPMFHARFCQPHSVISCLWHSQKAELSCYDIALRSSKCDHIVSDPGRIIPEATDFTVPWVETRPGHPDPKTGIPPSLYTLRVTDLLNKPVKVDLSLGRPLKLDFSETKMRQVVDLWNMLSATLPKQRKPAPVLEPLPKETHPPLLTTLACISDIHLDLDQLVVSMETYNRAGLHLSLSGLQSNTVLLQHEQVSIQELSSTTGFHNLAVHTTYDGRRQTLLGEFNTDLSVGLQWAPHSGPSHLPQTLIFVEASPIHLYLGHENLLALQEISQSIQQFVPVIEGESLSEGSPVTPHDIKPGPQPVPTSGEQPTEDDLRTGQFIYVTDDMGVDLLPAASEVVFGVDSETGQGTMTWCYPCPRVITHLTVTPVPFNVSQHPQQEYLPQVGCVIQYWSVIGKKFLDYKPFFLSEREHTHVSLPELSADFNPDIAISGIWRILIMPPESTTDQQTMNEGCIEPIISPMTLAASVKVSSALSLAYIPTLQVSFSTSLCQLQLANHTMVLGKNTPDALHPFTLVDCDPHEQEYLSVDCDDPILLVSYLLGKQNRTVITASTVVKCEVVEYRSFTMGPLLEPVGINIDVQWICGIEWQKLCVDLIMDDLVLVVSPGAIHTLTNALATYRQLKKPESERLIPEYYVICNDTQGMIRIRQCGTDETIIVGSRQAQPYSWRSHRHLQLLEVCMEGLGRQWCLPLSLDDEGLISRDIDTGSGQATIVVRIMPLNKIQKQVIISGQIVVSSRLTRPLHVRLSTCTIMKETTSVLGAMETLPSFVVPQKHSVSMKIRLENLRCAWSHEITLSDDKVKHSRLIKLPLQDKNSHVHVWCHIFCQKHGQITQHLLVFTPLFVVRTQLPSPLLMNIDTPRVHLSQQVALDGGGVPQQLHVMGGDMTHNLTFQLSPSMRPSSPAVTLSSGLIDQVVCQSIGHPDVHDLAYCWGQEDGAEWPYNKDTCPSKGELRHFRPHQEIIVPQQQLTTLKHPTHRAQTYTKNQPNIDLQINLSQLWAGCNTLLIDVVPYWLISNQSGTDLVLVGQEKSQASAKQWKVAHGQTFAPPVLEGPFRLGVMWSYMLHQSEAISLSEEDNLSRYLPNVPRLLYLHTDTHLTVPVIKEGILKKLCHLTLHSMVKDGLRVLTVRERFCLSNETPWSLSYKCLSVSLSPVKVDIHKEDLSSCTLASRREQKSVGQNPAEAERSKDNVESEMSLLLWDVPHTQSSLSTDMMDVNDANQLVHYVMFSLGAEPTSPMQWCHPVRIKLSDEGKRQTVVLPRKLAEGGLTTFACTLTAQLMDSIVYIVVHGPDPDPAILIHNNCDAAFHLGQTPSPNTQGVSVEEEAELTTSLPHLSPHSSCHYAFPSANTVYPEIPKTPSPYKLRLRVVPDSESSEEAGDDTRLLGEPEVNQGETEKCQLWSTGVDLQSPHETFVAIGNRNDVKVSSERVGHTTHVFIDPITRAEISAKEIRSRIKGAQTVIVKTSQKSLQDTPMKDHKDEPNSVSPPKARAKVVQVSREALKPKPSPKQKPPVLEIQSNVLLRKVVVVLIAEKGTEIQELLRATADDVIIIFTPEDITKVLTTRHTHYMQRLMLGVGDVQIDNQAYNRGDYTFPVVFVRQDWQKNRDPLPSTDGLFHLPKKEKWRELKKACIMYASVQLCNAVLEGRTKITKLSIASQPLSLHLEDSYIYDIVQYIGQLVATVPVDNQCVKRRVPLSVYCTSLMLSSPVRLHRISIEPVALLLSIHASLKLFIASDNTPLNFVLFERNNIFTSLPQLIRCLTMHYVSGALFRAGWVVGSLEILGSPAGLVRSIGNGVSDLFRLPYEGIARGPGAFVWGVTHGMASLLTHVSTGTLTSITNLASSVSKNMERLSLDADHCERQQESRKHKPEGISQGLKNGLTGLGLSLLGAVAGIADQPLQTLTRDDQAASTVASGFVSGVGKGLVGMVTKPIGGAAELVSQTGLGLLQGSGLTPFPAQRHQPTASTIAQYPNSMCKYRKMLDHVEVLSVLVAVSACEVRLSVEVTLVLTSRMLFIIDNETDVQQQGFSVGDISCMADEWDPSIMKLTISQVQGNTQNGPNLHSTDRVVEFIDKAAQFTPITSLDTEDMDQSEHSRIVEDQLGQKKQESRSERSKHSEDTCRKPRQVESYNFQMDHRLRHLFLTIFGQAKNTVSGYGFRV